MSVNKDWKKEYNTSWGLNKEQSLKYVTEVAHNLAVEACGETATPAEINGYEVGVITFFIRSTKELLPDVIKNIKVEALKAFQHTSKLYPEVTFPPEFYTGYMNGFCSMYGK